MKPMQHFFTFFLLALLTLHPKVLIAKDRVFPQKSGLLQLIDCLREEEKSIHRRKIIGPSYQLNRKFINLLILLSDLPISSEDVLKICQQQPIAPSLHLLQFMLIKGHKLGPNGQQGLHSAIFEEFLEEVPQVFIDYISSLQGQTDDPNCLEKNIPELAKILYDIRYMEEEVPLFTILERHKVQEVFTKLKDFPAILKRCQNPKPAAAGKTGKTGKTEKKVK